MKKIYLIGGGGHCKSCIDVIESTQEYQIMGIFDLKEKVGEKVLGYEIIGTDNDISKFTASDNYFLVTLGQIKSSELRVNAYKDEMNFATIISPRAYVSKHASIGSGTIVMHDAIINAGSIIGKNCILNSKALIEHECIVEDHCHISTGVIINGDCHIKSKTFIGSGTVIKNGKTIDAMSVISYGSRL